MGVDVHARAGGAGTGPSGVTQGAGDRVGVSPSSGRAPAGAVPEAANCSGVCTGVWSGAGGVEHSPPTGGGDWSTGDAHVLSAPAGPWGRGCAIRPEQRMANRLCAAEVPGLGDAVAPCKGVKVYCEGPWLKVQARHCL
jgi:hypothetical protein